MRIRTLKENPLTIERHKMDIKAKCILLNIDSNLHVLVHKGLFRKAIDKIKTDKTSRLSMIGSLSAQCKSFKFKKLSENCVSSLNYVIDTLNSRKRSLTNLNCPESEEILFQQMSDLIKNKLVKNDSILDTNLPSKTVSEINAIRKQHISHLSEFAQKPISLCYYEIFDVNFHVDQNFDLDILDMKPGRQYHFYNALLSRNHFKFMDSFGRVMKAYKEQPDTLEFHNLVQMHSDLKCFNICQ